MKSRMFLLVCCLTMISSSTLLAQLIISGSDALRQTKLEQKRLEVWKRELRGLEFQLEEMVRHTPTEQEALTKLWREVNAELWLGPVVKRSGYQRLVYQLNPELSFQLKQEAPNVVAKTGPGDGGIDTVKDSLLALEDLELASTEDGKTGRSHYDEAVRKLRGRIEGEILPTVRHVLAECEQQSESLRQVMAREPAATTSLLGLDAGGEFERRPLDKAIGLGLLDDLPSPKDVVAPRRRPLENQLSRVAVYRRLNLAAASEVIAFGDYPLELLANDVAKGRMPLEEQPLARRMIEMDVPGNVIQSILYGPDETRWRNITLPRSELLKWETVAQELEKEANKLEVGKRTWGPDMARETRKLAADVRAASRGYGPEGTSLTYEWVYEQIVHKGITLKRADEIMRTARRENVRSDFKNRIRVRK